MSSEHEKPADRICWWLEKDGIKKKKPLLFPKWLSAFRVLCSLYELQLLIWKDILIITRVLQVKQNQPEQSLNRQLFPYWIYRSCSFYHYLFEALECSSWFYKYVPPVYVHQRRLCRLTRRRLITHKIKDILLSNTSLFFWHNRLSLLIHLE